MVRIIFFLMSSAICLAETPANSEEKSTQTEPEELPVMGIPMLATAPSATQLELPDEPIEPRDSLVTRAAYFLSSQIETSLIRFMSRNSYERFVLIVWSLTAFHEGYLGKHIQIRF